MTLSIKNIKICECLIPVVQKELELGNTIQAYNETPEWPEQDSKFVILTNKISIILKNLPATVDVSINKDIHYGWHNEIYCNIHHDLLAAGQTERS